MPGTIELTPHERAMHNVLRAHAVEQRTVTIVGAGVIVTGTIEDQDDRALVVVHEIDGSTWQLRGDQVTAVAVNLPAEKLPETPGAE